MQQCIQWLRRLYTSSHISTTTLGRSLPGTSIPVMVGDSPPARPLSISTVPPEVLHDTGRSAAFPTNRHVPLPAPPGLLCCTATRPQSICLASITTVTCVTTLLDLHADDRSQLPPTTLTHRPSLLADRKNAQIKYRCCSPAPFAGPSVDKALASRLGRPMPPHSA